MLQKVVLSEKLALFSERWTPKIVGRVGDFHVKVAKIQGDFVWHSHEAEDEMFLVLQGQFVMKLRDGDVPLSAGEFLIVPRGVEHMPSAEQEASILLFEPVTTVNTGNAGGKRTVCPETI